MIFFGCFPIFMRCQIHLYGLASIAKSLQTIVLNKESTINTLPTYKSVLYATLRQTQKIAEECQQNYLHVTYNLAIAKVTLQIQHEEKSWFNNIFIHLGDFHIMMVYFKAIGKLQ